MPLFFEHHTDAAQVAVWKIEEPESFFLEATGLVASQKLLKRRLEFLVPRFLLKQLRPEFALDEIYVDTHGKPRLPEDAVWFSLSHSHPYVGVMVQEGRPCGIDVQVWHPRMRLLQEKFLTLPEIQILGEHEKNITIAWCAKEAVFKEVGRRVIEQNEELKVSTLNTEDNIITLEFNAKAFSGQYAYKYKLFNEFALTYSALKQT